MSEIFMGEPTSKFEDWCERKYGYLCFKAEEAGATISLRKLGSPDTIYLQTSTDKKNWTSYTIGDEITIENIGDKVYFRADPSNVTGKFSKTMFGNYYCFKIQNKRISASGNVMSLVDPECKETSIRNEY